MIETSVTPYEHQRRELEEHGLDLQRALPWQMRTGKTPMPIWSGSALWRKGVIDGVALLAPTGVHETWAVDEVPRHSTVPAEAFHWSCRREREAPGEHRSLLSSLFGAQRRGRLPWFCAGKEAFLIKRVWSALKRFAERHPRLMLIVDESHHYGGGNNRGTARVRALADRACAHRILSGTMVGNSPGRVYSQFRILGRGTLGFDVRKEFVERYGRFVFDGEHWRQDGWRDLEDLRERMAEWGRPVLRSDCEDLPPVVSAPRYHDLSEEAMTLHDEALEEGEKRDPPQLHEARRIAMREKVPAILDALQFAELPAVVWVPFVDEVERIAHEMREGIKAWGGTTVAHHGDLPDRKRSAALDLSRGNKRSVLVSTPDSLSEGRDLSHARSIVWSAPVWDSVLYEQANERCTRMGGETTTGTELCASGTIESRMWACVRKKVSRADWLAGTGLRDLMEERGIW